MDIKLEIPQEIADANCERYGYTGFVNEEPQSQEDFIITLLSNYLNAGGKEHIISKAVEIAKEEAEQSISHIEVKKGK